MRLDRHTLIPLVIVAWTLGVTVARSIRLPNDFAEAHWLIDYRFGLVNRGLIGSFCNFFLSLAQYQMNPSIIVVLSAVVSLCLLAGLLLVSSRILHRHCVSADAQLMLLVFASSPFVVMNAHCFGYFDALLYLFTMAAITFILTDRPFFASLFSVVAVLSHEGYVVIGFPLVCLASVALLVSRDPAPRWHRHVTALMVPIVVFLVMPFVQSLQVERIVVRIQLEALLDEYGFVPTMSKYVPAALTKTLPEWFFIHASEAKHNMLRADMLGLIGPSLGAILYFIHASFRLRSFDLFSCILLSAVLAPLGMHAVAGDTARIWTFTVGGCFIAAWIVAERLEPQESQGLLPLLALPALLINIFGRTPLMDRELERFSDCQRLLLYTPTIVLALTAVRSSIRPYFLAQFRKDRTAHVAVDSDGAVASRTGVPQGEGRIP